MPVQTSEKSPIEAVKDILQETSLFSNTDPEIHRIDETTQQFREQNSDPAIYLGSNVDDNLDAFDAEVSNYDQTQVIEASIWLLSNHTNTTSDLVREYKDDVIDIIDQYSTDTNDNTNFIYIRPIGVTDSRQDTIVRRTDHLIMSVQIETRKLR